MSISYNRGHGKRHRGEPLKTRNPKHKTRHAGSGRDRRPDKSLGQHFLKDQNILAIEAELADPEGKIVLEVGPGDGRLTDAVLAKNPAKLIAIEKDPRFAQMLREKYSGSRKIEIIEGDFLEVPLPESVDVVVGNIPYYISSGIVFHLRYIRFGRGVLMVQKEFAEKMVAKPGERNYGRLSVTSQLAFDIKFERKVLRHLFRPPPEVDSAIIVIRPTGFRASQLQENIIRWLFQHRNKTVRNALLDSKMFKDEDLAAISHYLKRRARELSKEECLDIAKRLENV
ncbi:MAG: 16S rRNA (adenine(1518)-N(6)/adenine(1519)-N(6))-dimethyltransferase RsmA [Candidatus Micrarchaeota archaeon]